MSELKTKAMNALLEMGVNPSTRGFKYTLDAIELAEKDENWLGNITGMYIEISQLHKDIGATGTRVERAIRHMMEMVATYSSLEILEKYVSMNGDKITNSKFISSLYYNLSKSNSTDQVKQARPTKSDGDTCVFCGSKQTILDVQGIHICEECAKKIAVKLIEL